eukprot:5950_1
MENKVQFWLNGKMHRNKKSVVVKYDQCASFSKDNRSIRSEKLISRLRESSAMLTCYWVREIISLVLHRSQTHRNHEFWRDFSTGKLPLSTCIFGSFTFEVLTDLRVPILPAVFYEYTMPLIILSL